MTVTDVTVTLREKKMKKKKATQSELLSAFETVLKAIEHRAFKKEAVEKREGVGDNGKAFESH